MDWARLRKLIIQHFDIEELQDLCFDLDIDYDSLRGEGKAAKARSLLSKCRGKKEIELLLTLCQQARPNVDWPKPKSKNDSRPSSSPYTVPPQLLGIIIGVVVVIIVVGLLATSDLPAQIASGFTSTSTPTSTPTSIPTRVPTKVPSPFPTPQPTMVRVSSSTLLISDNFSSTETGWDDYFDDLVDTGYEAEKYYIELTDERLFLSVWGASGNRTDGVFQVTLLGSTSLHGISEQGIAVGWQSDWSTTTYAFTLNSEDTCKVFKSVLNPSNPSNPSWRRVGTGEIEEFNSELDGQVLTVAISDDNEAVVYVNSEFCAKTFLTDYEGGKVGVVALGTNIRGRVYFDNYRVYALP